MIMLSVAVLQGTVTNGIISAIGRANDMLPPEDPEGQLPGRSGRRRSLRQQEIPEDQLPSMCIARTA